VAMSQTIEWAAVWTSHGGDSHWSYIELHCVPALSEIFKRRKVADRHKSSWIDARGGKMVSNKQEIEYRKERVRATVDTNLQSALCLLFVSGKKKERVRR